MIREDRPSSHKKEMQTLFALSTLFVDLEIVKMIVDFSVNNLDTFGKYIPLYAHLFCAAIHQTGLLNDQPNK